MDAGTNDAASFADRLQRLRNERAIAREDDRRIERGDCRFVRSAGPHCSELAREALCVGVTGPGERVHPRALLGGDLGYQMRRRAESVQTQFVNRWPRHLQGAPTVQAGAKQGRQLHGVCRSRQEHGVGRLGHDVRSKAAVPAVPCEERGVAHRFSRPPQQKRQLPHVWASQGTPTRSPTPSPATPAPRASTVPTISCPGTSGR